MIRRSVPRNLLQDSEVKRSMLVRLRPNVLSSSETHYSGSSVTSERCSGIILWPHDQQFMLLKTESISSGPQTRIVIRMIASKI